MMFKVTPYPGTLLIISATSSQEYARDIWASSTPTRTLRAVSRSTPPHMELSLVSPSLRPHLVDHFARFYPFSECIHMEPFLENCPCPFSTICSQRQILSWWILSTSGQSNVQPHIWSFSSGDPSERSFVVPLARLIENRFPS
jgi:hypothetical protein